MLLLASNLRITKPGGLMKAELHCKWNEEILVNWEFLNNLLQLENKCSLLDCTLGVTARIQMQVELRIQNVQSAARVIHIIKKVRDHLHLAHSGGYLHMVLWNHRVGRHL